MNRRAVSLFVFAGAGLNGQGFGTFSKTTINLHRTMPPYVSLKEKRIKIDARNVSVDPQTAQLPGLLRTKLITEIQKDSGFIEDEVNPHTILRLSFTNFYIVSVW